VRGAAAQHGLAEVFRAAAPDKRLVALRAFEDGDAIVVEGVSSGTQTGDLVGPGGTIPPSGRTCSLPCVGFLPARDGKILSHRIYWDNATFMVRLGVMPGG
jgi:ketosteroid isomerase-like protein